VNDEAPRPQPLGLRPSVGLGDRIGLATPGHVRALRSTGSRLAPIFAQQSIREMERTGRSPCEVMDDATRALAEAGWDAPFGADADHLKTTEHIDRCLPHGYTFFTIDPSDHVGAPVPWERLEDTPRDLVARLAKPLDLGDRALEPTADELLGAAATYGAAVAHVADLYEHLRDRAPAGSFELEVSVDETDTRTTHAQHVYIADALARLGVGWVSLAPRFVGSFEKGIDYLGDVGALADDVAVHAAIARRLGPYKLSVHSGSDKFSAYPAIAEATGGVLHLKTAGTSYLEALRAAWPSRRGAAPAHLRPRARALRRGSRDLPPLRRPARPGGCAGPGGPGRPPGPPRHLRLRARERARGRTALTAGRRPARALRRRARPPPRPPPRAVRLVHPVSTGYLSRSHAPSAAGSQSRSPRSPAARRRAGADARGDI
jgi:tagaturonate epimerase